jgi:hypothetical protein
VIVWPVDASFDDRSLQRVAFTRRMGQRRLKLATQVRTNHVHLDLSLQIDLDLPFFSTD